MISEQERYKNTISPQGKNLLMSLDCTICTGHWQENGKELDTAAETHFSWMLQHLLPGKSRLQCPTLPMHRAQEGSTLCCLPVLPGKGTRLPWNSSEAPKRPGRKSWCPPCTVCGNTSALGIPVPSCLYASPTSRTPSSCGRTLIIVPQKHHRGFFQSHLRYSAC